MPSGYTIPKKIIEENLFQKGFTLVNYESTAKKIRVRCFCGKEFDTYYHSLIDNQRKNCSCTKKLDSIKNRLLPEIKRKINKWTILSIDEDVKDKDHLTLNDIRYICECDCGTIRSVSRKSLIGNNTISCGCILQCGYDIDLRHNKYEKLTVIDFEYAIRGKTGKWICVCECGNTHKVTANHLTSGAVKSCGNCQNNINGRKCSFIQKKLFNLIKNIYPNYDISINYVKENRNFDIAIESHKIAIEYDEWFWHGFKQDKDEQRNKQIIDFGWSLLVIRASDNLPRESVLKNKINKLLTKRSVLEVLKLRGWGHKQTFMDVK